MPQSILTCPAELWCTLHEIRVDQYQLAFAKRQLIWIHPLSILSIKSMVIIVILQQDWLGIQLWKIIQQEKGYRAWKLWYNILYSPFIMLCLGFIEMLSYNRTILQRNYRKMTNFWSFSYNSFVKFHGKKNLGATAWTCYIQICVITRCVLKGMHCNELYPHLIEITKAHSLYSSWLPLWQWGNKLNTIQACTPDTFLKDT